MADFCTCTVIEIGWEKEMVALLRTMIKNMRRGGERIGARRTVFPEHHPIDKLIVDFESCICCVLTSGSRLWKYMDYP